MAMACGSTEDPPPWTSSLPMEIVDTEFSSESLSSRLCLCLGPAWVLAPLNSLAGEPLCLRPSLELGPSTDPLARLRALPVLWRASGLNCNGSCLPVASLNFRYLTDGSLIFIWAFLFCCCRTILFLFFMKSAAVAWSLKPHSVAMRSILACLFSSWTLRELSEARRVACEGAADSGDAACEERLVLDRSATGLGLLGVLVTAKAGEAAAAAGSSAILAGGERWRAGS